MPKLFTIDEVFSRLPAGGTLHQRERMAARVWAQRYINMNSLLGGIKNLLTREN